MDMVGSQEYWQQSILAFLGMTSGIGLTNNELWNFTNLMLYIKTSPGQVCWMFKYSFVG